MSVKISTKFAVTEYSFLINSLVFFPLSRKSGLTYFNPQLCQWSKRLIPIEAAAMDNSYVLLFVITSTTRSIASMALVRIYKLRLSKWQIVKCIF